MDATDKADRIFWKYAPIWAITFATAATVAKSLGQRYILQREFEFNWSDVATAAAGAVLGYTSYRLKHEDMHEHGAWYKR